LHSVQLKYNHPFLEYTSRLKTFQFFDIPPYPHYEDFKFEKTKKSVINLIPLDLLFSASYGPNHPNDTHNTGFLISIKFFDENFCSLLSISSIFFFTFFNPPGLEA